MKIYLSAHENHLMFLSPAAYIFTHCKICKGILEKSFWISQKFIKICAISKADVQFKLL